MLSQHHRFHGHGSLRYVYKNGDSVRSRVVTIKYTRNKFRDHSRFSVVVSKKVLKSAVGRNRIRRRIYEILRLQLPYIDDNYDIVVLVFSSEVISLPYTDLQDIVTSQLLEANIIKPDHHKTVLKSDIITDSKNGDTK